MDFNGYSVAELREMRDEISEVIKEKAEAEKATREATLAARDAEMRGKVNAGDIVLFEYNKGTREGKVLRTNEKSVTVEFDLEGETVSRYRKYSAILEVVNAAEATEEETSEEEDAE